MKKFAVIAASALLWTGAATAADLATMPTKAVAPAPAEPLWDLAFGVTATSDYVFRGISQTNNNPAIQGYAELQLFNWVYFNVWASNQNWVQNFMVGPGASSLEVDFSGGLRHTWGGLTVDVGGIYYSYPGGTDYSGVKSTDYNYWEIYFKPSYAFTDWLTIGAALNWTSDFAATNTDGTALSANFKATLPTFGPGAAFGWYVSGEFGHQWLDTSSYNYTNYFGLYTDIPGYNWWNVGLGFTYKAATLDLRYSGTDLGSQDCNYIIGNQNACGSKFIASLSFATSFNQLK